MTVTHSLLQYKDSNGNVYEGDLFVPRTTGMRKLPGVVVYSAFRGITDFEREKAATLAQEGYIALAADPFGKGIRPTDKMQCFEIVRPLVSERIDKLKPVIIAAIDAIKTVQCIDDQKIGAIGFCFGGLCVLDLARYNIGLKAVVSFHGTLKPLPNFPLDSIIGTAIQVHHGDADSHIPKEQVDEFHVEMRTRNADFVFSSHAFAEHGFTEPEADSFGLPGVKYNKKAADRSWNSAISLFKEVF
uniref:DLH domain-containing protein n=1 Tax=Caenorhabditis tropicalis TaxID=1561998 RepID=A0A1I7T029_9PELO